MSTILRLPNLERKRKRPTEDEDPRWNTALDARLKEMFGPCSESTEPEEVELDAPNLGCHRSGQMQVQNINVKEQNYTAGVLQKDRIFQTLQTYLLVPRFALLNTILIGGLCF